MLYKIVSSTDTYKHESNDAEKKRFETLFYSSAKYDFREKTTRKNIK